MNATANTDDLTREVGSAKQFMTKAEAIRAAKSVPGFRPSDVTRQSIMGFWVWVISDPHMNFLSREGFERWTSA